MVVRVVRLGTARGDRRRPAHRHRAPPAARRAEVGVRVAATGTTCGIPNLAPSVETMKLGPGSANPGAMGRVHHGSTGPRWRSPTQAARIDLLAALSQHADFSVGCYCEDEAHCHRSVLRALLLDKGARVA